MLGAVGELLSRAPVPYSELAMVERDRSSEAGSAAR
jgi:hypothetical protein